MSFSDGFELGCAIGAFVAMTAPAVFLEVACYRLIRLMK